VGRLLKFLKLRRAGSKRESYHPSPRPPLVRSISRDLPRRTGPSFSGDGIGEVFFDREFCSKEGTPLFSLEDYFLAGNKYEPGP
jgi:hypothetical protein